MAGEEGFEPPNGGSKGRCLTTWLLPNGELQVNKEWSDAVNRKIRCPPKCSAKEGRDSKDLKDAKDMVPEPRT